MFAYKVCNGSEAKLPVAGGLANSIALSAANDNTGAPCHLLAAKRHHLVQSILERFLGFSTAACTSRLH